MNSFADLLDEWHNATYQGIERHLTMTENGLVLGAGTVLARYGADAFGVRCLALEGREDQILALLAITYWRAIPASILENFRRAAKAYARGEKVAAHMHLAFTGLHGLEDEKPASLRLFLAERLLGLGLSPQALLAALEIDQPKFEPRLAKASPNDPKHPGWPAGTEGGVGGQFRPKDLTDGPTSEEAMRRIGEEAARRWIRNALVTLLRLGIEAGLGLIPGGEAAAAYTVMAEVLNAASAFEDLKRELDAALAFVAHGPYSLMELQAPGVTQYKEFPSFAEFKKGVAPRGRAKKYYGPAGTDWEYHHVVTQGGENETNIAPELLNNTENIVAIPKLLHQALNAKYSERKEGTNMTVYQWLQTQPYGVQREEGLKMMRDINILK